MKSHEDPIATEIKVNTSSIIQLKAELSKKQTQFTKSKTNAVSIQSKPLNLKSLKGEVKPNERALETVDTALEASWVALKRKTKQYEELHKLGDDVQDDNVLVDFLLKDEPEQKKSKFELVKDDYVEIEDEFGRTRLVKKELVAQNETPNDYSNLGFEKENGDQEEEPKVSTLHFDHSAERRNMGQVFYKFSKDEEKRQEQMVELNKMRIDTLESRSKLDQKKTERDKKLQERREMIAKRAALRKRKLGVVDGDHEKDKEATEFLNSII